MKTIVIVGAVLLLVALLLVVANVSARRAGYSVPGRTVVRCSAGHLFWTTWVMGGSLTTIRLGPLLRYGRCPVGNHWALIRPVKEAELTESDRRSLGEDSKS